MNKQIVIGTLVLAEVRHFLEVMGESSFSNDEEVADAGSMAEYYNFTYAELKVLSDKVLNAKVGKYARIDFSFKEAVLMYGELDNRYDIESSNSYESNDDEAKMARRLKAVMDRFVQAFGKDVTRKR